MNKNHFADFLRAALKIQKIREVVTNDPLYMYILLTQ